MTSSVVADGKHLLVAGEPFRVRGVTYGSFAPRLDGELFPDTYDIKKDLFAMEAAGINTLRTYSLPPAELLDTAAELGLKLLVGLHYEDWCYRPSTSRSTTRAVLDSGLRAVDAALERCSGRPEVLAVSVGNEVPADVVRANGIRNVERTLSRLAHEIKSGDRSLLVTYNNFPTTSYLDIEHQDFISYNVFLEDPVAYRRYLRHLQVRAGELPVVLTEVGLAAGVHGEDGQAETLEWQLRIADETGISGATVFSWTDEWAVGGKPVEGWGFGITRTDRTPKPSFEVVSRWARSSIRDLRPEWPTMSAIVCAYDAERYIEECLDSLVKVDYPGFEVVVLDDGSSDRTLELARRFPVKLIQLEHGGLSRARNAGIEASTGEIVAFIDADAYCHPEWPYHVALSLEDEGVVATGGPNLPVQVAGLAEHVVAGSPGGPTHVLITDDRAEHVPGCNMAYRREIFDEIGGFDPIYTAAGDDVDACWKILDADKQIAFSAAAQVRHHRRDSLRAYLKQQKGYGRAERLVASRHPQRFNRLGQARWTGFIYGSVRILSSLLRPIVYHGYQGIAPYQGVVLPRSEVTLLWTTALLPLLLPLIALDLVIEPALGWFPRVTFGLLLALLTFAGIVTKAATPPPGVAGRGRYRVLVGGMHILQPFFRTWGRIRSRKHPAAPMSGRRWTGERTVWLRALSGALTARGAYVSVGSPNESWDLEVRKGLFVAYRLTTAILWGWTPVLSRRLWPRVHGLVLFGGAVVLGLFHPLLGLATAGAFAALAGLETLLLHRDVMGAIDETTAEAVGS